MESIRMAIAVCVIQSAVTPIPMVMARHWGLPELDKPTGISGITGDINGGHQITNPGTGTGIGPGTGTGTGTGMGPATGTGSGSLDIGSGLETIQNNTHNIIMNIQQSVTHAFQDIQRVLEDASNRWNRTIQKVVSIAQAVNYANDDCILSATPLDNITLGFRSDVANCIQDDMDELRKVGDRGSDVEWKFTKLVTDTQLAINNCGQSNLPTSIACWIQNFPSLIFRTISLYIEALTTEFQLLNLKNIIDIKSYVCVASGLVNREKQALGLAKDKIKCLSAHTKDAGEKILGK